MAGPRDAKKVDVTVTVNSDVPGDFTIEPSPPGSLPTGPNGELIFENDGHPGFFIHFNLIDKSGLGYKFPPQKKIRSAVWSELGVDRCPQDGKMEVFDPRNVEKNGMTLIVHNPNAGKAVGKFYYMLRVTNDGGSSYLPLDPGGTNKNGPTEPPFLASWIAPTISGAIVALGTVALLSNSLVPATVVKFAVGGAVVGLIVGLLLGRR